MSLSSSTTSAHRIAERVANFVRTVVVEYEQDPRWGPHGPTDELANELKESARAGSAPLHERMRLPSNMRSPDTPSVRL
jgi:acyl-CoA dehydrogenase